MARKWIQSLDLEVDESNVPTIETALKALQAIIAAGRLKVDASGVNLTADIVDADMNQVTGAAPSSKNLFDVWTQLATLLGEAADAQADAGGEGTASAKLRRLSTDLSTLITRLETISKAEDTAYTAEDSGVPPVAVRKDARGQAGSAADGDYAPLQITANGDLRTRDDDVNTAIGHTTDAKADVDGAGSLIAQIRRVGFEADRAADLLGVSDDAAAYGDVDGTLKAAIRGLAASLYAVGDGTGDKPGVLVEKVRAVLGATDDAVVDAGATGSLSAKLRRLTTELDTANTALTAMQAALESGLPASAEDATGHDAYSSIVSAPARTCHYLHVAVGDNGAVVSLDGGTTDHFYIPANVERMFPGLSIPSGADIQAKNLSTGSNYSNLRVSVW